MTQDKAYQTTMGSPIRNAETLKTDGSMGKLSPEERRRIAEELKRSAPRIPRHNPMHVESEHAMIDFEKEFEHKMPNSGRGSKH